MRLTRRRRDRSGTAPDPATNERAADVRAAEDRAADGRAEAQHRSDRRAPGRFERSMFSFMGPAQVGEDRPREGYVPDPAAALCRKCGEPWEAHERVHTGSMTYRTCPATAPTPATGPTPDPTPT